MMFVEENKGKLGVFVGIDKVRIKREVRLGDILIMEVEMIIFRKNIVKVDVKVYVGEEFVCKGELMFVLVEK